jgi:PmbA protein
MQQKDFEAKRNSVLDIIQSSVDKIKKEGIEEVEIFAGFGAGTSLTIEKNDIQTFESFEDTVFGIRVIKDGCEGFVTTNNPADLLESAKEALALARAQNTPDPCLELPPNPDKISEPIDHLDPSLFGLDPNRVLEIAKAILETKATLSPKVSLDSADASLSYSLKAIANSKGLLRSEAASSLSASFMGMAIDGSDIGSFDSESAFGRSWNEFEESFQEKYPKFLEACMSGLGARTISGFKGFVYLPPDSIFSFLIGGLLGSLNSTAVRKKKSKFAESLDKKIISHLLNISTEPTNRDLATATAFDREGQNTINFPVIQEGVLRNFFYNHYEAKKAGLPGSNGSASGDSSTPPGSGPRGIQIGPGKTRLKEILNPGSKYLWVNRFSGTSSALSGEFSGVIKGGFLVESGEKIPVKEVQISGNMFDVLANQIEAVSEERELLGKSTWAPSILLNGIQVIGSEQSK